MRRHMPLIGIGATSIITLNCIRIARIPVYPDSELNLCELYLPRHQATIDNCLFR